MQKDSAFRYCTLSGKYKNPSLKKNYSCFKRSFFAENIDIDFFYK